MRREDGGVRNLKKNLLASGKRCCFFFWVGGVGGVGGVSLHNNYRKEIRLVDAHYSQTNTDTPSPTGISHSLCLSWTKLSATQPPIQNSCANHLNCLLNAQKSDWTYNRPGLLEMDYRSLVLCIFYSKKCRISHLL